MTRPAETTRETGGNGMRFDVSARGCASRSPAGRGSGSRRAPPGWCEFFPVRTGKLHIGVRRLRGPISGSPHDSADPPPTIPGRMCNMATPTPHTRARLRPLQRRPGRDDPSPPSPRPHGLPLVLVDRRLPRRERLNASRRTQNDLPAELSTGCVVSAGFACHFRRFRVSFPPVSAKRGGEARTWCWA